MEEYLWQWKSYVYMRERLKSDKISYSLRQNKLKKDLDTTYFSLNSADVHAKQSK